MVLRSFSLIAISTLILAGCNSQVAQPNPTNIEPGLYSGERTCHYVTYDAANDETLEADDTSEDFVEISDNGRWVLNSTEVRVGQEAIFHVGGLDGRATITSITTTDTSIVVTFDIVYTLSDGTTSIDLEGEGTFTIAAEGADSIRETGEISVSHTNGSGTSTFIQDCEGILTR